VSALARRAAFARVVEAALAGRIDVDQVEARQSAGQTPHQRGLQPLVVPAVPQAVAERVVAERRRVRHRQPPRPRAARQIDGRVQRVSSEALAHRAECLALQFEHAFAERNDAQRPCHGISLAI
jgi:hypothetical protein